MVALDGSINGLLSYAMLKKLMMSVAGLLGSGSSSSKV
jgi:hypothetical protein